MRIIPIILLLFISLTTFAQLPPLASGVYPWNYLPPKAEKDRETRKIAEGTTNEFERFRIYIITQHKGAAARSPHAYSDVEQVVIIKEGRLKCTIGSKTATLGAGSVLLIPPGEMQAVVNAGDGPATYYVFMFQSKKQTNLERSKRAGGSLMINYDTLKYTEKDNRGTRKYFDRPTATCENYEMHTTYLKTKGPSHAPHQHVDTEIILMIEGETEMTIDDKTFKAGPGDLYLVQSGKMHGISNASDKPCSYFAFKWR